MRAKDRAAVAELIREQLEPVNGYLTKLTVALADMTNGVMDAIDEVKPASVDLTQEMADDIVRKIHGPLTISKEFSQWVAEQGKFHDFFYTFPVGFGADAARGELRMQGNGTMHLTIADQNGAHLWRGTFVPPDFGVSS